MFTMTREKVFTSIIEKSLSLRKDPLEGASKNRVRQVPKISADVTGRNVLARLLFSQRLYILKLSLLKFGNLCSEDYRRVQLRKLAQDFDQYEFESVRAEFFGAVEEYNEIVPISITTLSRLENTVGNEGATAETLSFLAERLVNPVTLDFFSQSDIVNLYLGFESNTVNLEYIDDISKSLISAKGRDTGEFVTLTRSLNRKKSELLSYPLSTHAF
jgi:hypothetical protein